MENKKLPKVVEQYLNKNTTFNMFGLVNINVLKSSTGSKIGNETLKRMIQKRFSHEMANGEIDFI
jgi:hypothetical protein